MLDKIASIVGSAWRHIVPCQVLDEYERGVVLQWGKFNRLAEPGINWLWPVAEVCSYETVVRRTTYLDVQSVTTKDGHPVNIGPIVVWSVSNIRRFILEVDEPEKAVEDIVYGVIDEQVASHNWEFVRSERFAESVTAQAKKIAPEWGWKCHAVKFSDRSHTRAMRIWQN